MSKRVKVRVPGEASLLQFPSGDQVIVNVDSAGRLADILEDDARLIMFSGLPDSIAWRELNPGLVETLKPLQRKPAVRLVDLERAANDAQSISPFDKVSIARTTLSFLRGHG